jgi:peptidoglycan/LPS O-acetylase OafA/YrhL
MSGLTNPQRIDNVDFLRGVAALAVCWYHFTNSDPAFLPDGWLKRSGFYGWLGVEVFFVISGFIIPYALSKAGYRLSQYRIFLLKRITRLDPPYLVSIVIAIVVIYGGVALGIKASDERLNTIGILLHLGYLNAFFNYPWLNAVYWTLAIEFQYYLLIGLLFPLISNARRSLRLLTFAGLGGAAFVITRGNFIFHWLFLFCIGITAFQFRRRLIGRSEFLALIVVFAAGCFFTLGFPHLLAGLAALIVITNTNRNISYRVFKFFGNISYSLYLLHALTGGAVVVVGKKLGLAETYQGKLVLILVAVSVSIASAHLLFLLVERPAQRWSSSFKYHPRDPEKVDHAAEPARPEELPLIELPVTSHD